MNNLKILKVLVIFTPLIVVSLWDRPIAQFFNDKIDFSNTDQVFVIIMTDFVLLAIVGGLSIYFTLQIWKKN